MRTLMPKQPAHAGEAVLLTRRQAAALAVTGLFCPWSLSAAEPTSIHVTKDPNCGCCGGWVEHLRAAGFNVSVDETPRVNPLKSRLGIPHDLWSCHTAQTGRYAIEGHVPAAAIRRLLSEQPEATGLAVPGMPIGSPGMEVEGSPPEEYTVFVFGTVGQRPYGRFKGSAEIAG
jgi:hypothetical protein